MDNTAEAKKLAERDYEAEKSFLSPIYYNGLVRARTEHYLKEQR